LDSLSPQPFLFPAERDCVVEGQARGLENAHLEVGIHIGEGTPP
jgi:hypothetical protein